MVCPRLSTREWPLLVQCGHRLRTTPRRTRFRDVQHARNMATVWVDDDKTKSDYDIKKNNWNYVCLVKPNDERVRHQWQSENQDQHKAHETRHLTSECARSLLVSSCCVCVVILILCTPHRVSQVVRMFVSSHPCMKWAALFDFELSIPSNFLLYSPSISSSSCCPSTSTRISSNTVYSANKEMESTDESYSAIWACVQKATLERGDPLFAVLGQKPQTCDFHDLSLLWQLDRLRLTSVCCNRRGV